MATLSKAQQREIMRQDAERRLERDIAEHLLLNKSSDATPSETGVPNNHMRNPKASADCWSRGLKGRTVGVAPGTEAESDGTPTVRVIYANGESHIEPARGFGKGTRTVLKRDTVAPRQTDIQRFEHIIGTNSDVD